jgi:saccharopine dehydrogenase (NAD+, L-lysine forming)
LKGGEVVIMKNTIGLRLEDKNPWERRVALTPCAVRELIAQGARIRVERFARRTFADAEYERSGAAMGDVRDCDLVFGIKEMPRDYFREGGAYMMFSHTIKGQPYNMGMLRELVDKRCTLLDYETVTDDEGKRLIFFGRYAGLAGMIDTLWTLGKRLEALGHRTAFGEIRPAHAYADLDAAKAAVRALGDRIAAEGVPRFLAPAVVGFTGYGHVSRGAQEIFDILPHVEVAPDALAGFVASNDGLADRLVKVVYREADLVEPNDPSRPFDLQRYYLHGEEHRSKFAPHLGLLTALVNGIYWDVRYPKFATREEFAALLAGGGTPKLLAVGDISCDVDGSLACTVRDTTPGDPVFVYDPVTGEAPSGFEGRGFAVMAVGNLPCELPREASSAFSGALEPYIQALAEVDLGGTFEAAALPEPIRRSVILWRGTFTPRYMQMRGYLEGTEGR